MTNRQYRLILAAESAFAFVLQLKDAPRRVIEAARRLKAAVDAAYAADHEQLGAKNSRKGPRHSVTRAKKFLLRKHLDPIAADGREMFAGLPGIDDSLKLPRIKDAADKHLKAAERVRRVAEEHEQEFIDERDYDENFLESFDTAVRDLAAAARAEPGAGRARLSRATADVKDEIARVRLAFDALDTRVQAAYLDDKPTLALWRRASRVPAKTGRPRKPKSPPKPRDDDVKPED